MNFLFMQMTVSSRDVHEHTIHQLLTDDKLTDEKHHLAKEMRKNNEVL